MALILPRRPIFDHVPVVHLPQDERSNLINPPSLASAISHVNSIALICMAILVICRFWVRGAILRNLSWDDCK